MNRIGSLFSGIGGLELGLEWAGLGRVAWQVEQSEFCRGVLAEHWPDADRSVTDVRAARSLPRVDVICGGFPCQDVSAAGLGAGLDGRRSGLWFEFRRVVAELRPEAVVVENVASGKSRWLCAVRSDLHALGYRTRALLIHASDVGAPHRRARIFVIALASTVELGRDVGPETRVDAHGRPTRRLESLGQPSDGDPRLADTNGERPEAVDLRSGGQGEAEGRVVALAGGLAGAMAHADGDGIDDEARRAAAAREERAGRPELGGSGEPLADADGQRVRLGAERVPRRRARSVQGQGGPEPAHAGTELAHGHGHGHGREGERRSAIDDRLRPARGDSSLGCRGADGAALNARPAPQSGVGRGADGLSAGLDARPAALASEHRWPAGRGAEQHDWEPDRAVVPDDFTSARLEALGNAVVPQCAELAGLELQRWRAAS